MVNFTWIISIIFFHLSTQFTFEINWGHIKNKWASFWTLTFFISFEKTRTDSFRRVNVTDRDCQFLNAVMQEKKNWHICWHFAIDVGYNNSSRSKIFHILIVEFHFCKLFDIFCRWIQDGYSRENFGNWKGNCPNTKE